MKGRSILCALALAAAMSFGGCELFSGGAKASVAVTSVSIAGGDRQIGIGGTLTLVATVSPSDATTQTVTWASSDSTVATVAGGTVTAIGLGTATISATSTDGAKAGSVAIKVDLTGAWIQTYGTSVNTIVVATDGSFTSVTANSGSSPATYSGNKGSMTLTGDRVVWTTTASFPSTSSATAITAAGATWGTLAAPTIYSSTVAYIDGSFYQSIGQYPVFKAAGTHSGLVGTWDFESYSMASTNQYMKAHYVFAANGALTADMYSSATSTYPTAPTNSATGTYTDNGNGTVTLTTTSAQTYYYLLSGDYWVLGTPTTVTGLGFVKQ